MAFSECILYFIIKTKEEEEKEKKGRKNKNWEEEKRNKAIYAQGKESCGGRSSNTVNKWLQNMNFIPVF